MVYNTIVVTITEITAHISYKSFMLNTNALMQNVCYRIKEKKIIKLKNLWLIDWMSMQLKHEQFVDEYLAFLFKNNQRDSSFLK